METRVDIFITKVIHMLKTALGLKSRVIHEVIHIIHKNEGEIRR